MSEHKVKLEQIEIRKPCPMPWEDMVGDDQVRFCGHCNLNVYNLSAMTRDEAEQLIENREGRLCGRMFVRSDGMVLTADCEKIRFALARKVYYKVAASVALLFAMLVGGAFAAKKADDIGSSSGRNGPWIFSSPPVRAIGGAICIPAPPVPPVPPVTPVTPVIPVTPIDPRNPNQPRTPGNLAG